MTGDAGPGSISRVWRPGRTVLLVVAVLLLLGGGTAVAVGVAGQDADPPTPSESAAPASTSARADSAPPSSSSGVPAPDASAPTPPTSVPPVPVALPVSVRIPAIDVQSELITLGLNTDGTLAVPQPGPDYDKAAWFDGSPRPGDPGPAVIEGHVDSAANGPSVFYDLGRLVTGDRIEVTREDGSVAPFLVDKVRVVPKDDFPTLEVYGNTDGPELRLITCGGPFDSSAGSYVDNVVVFASQSV
ncbi:class F sortase [Blastococcus mobilis]|uniref:LPXTG-site transpeptidase (Sortase) family protein n=1 Tax=Blastococcus mobilis TaxID=1938746 RepID=A0A239AJ88_9ACTN|nr:class F sortase [Blastococcus mobilis]SNR95610.1 LPXTG-site transpeptidase (sortase) family protein [Blastococcus mobilis]